MFLISWLNLIVYLDKTNSNVEIKSYLSSLKDLITLFSTLYSRQDVKTYPCCATG